MDAAQKRVLQNQIEIMWALRWLMEKSRPDLVGKAGELDSMRDDLSFAARETKTILEKE